MSRYVWQLEHDRNYHNCFLKLKFLQTTQLTVTWNCPSFVRKIMPPYWRNTIPVTAQSQEVALRIGFGFGIRYRKNTDQLSLLIFNSLVSWSALLKEARKYPVCSGMNWKVAFENYVQWLKSSRLLLCPFLMAFKF